MSVPSIGRAMDSARDMVLGRSDWLLARLAISTMASNSRPRSSRAIWSAARCSSMLSRMDSTASAMALNVSTSAISSLSP